MNSFIIILLTAIGSVVLGVCAVWLEVIISRKDTYGTVVYHCEDGDRTYHANANGNINFDHYDEDGK